uniref:Uncharacterized protein n=1 Tax=Brassica oleracea TaxID=3712 RepID=A0A3P6E6Y5_BRAOL|nr:unnamed protein product [Brassica oleracea]
MFLWAEFRDPRFYPSSCESLPSIATIGGLTEAARPGTLPRRIQITSKRRLSFSTGVHNAIEFLSDDSPDMDVIGISDNFFSDINKPDAVNCIEGHVSSLSRFKSHASNIVFDEHSENILPSSESDVGLAASSGLSVLGDKVDEECAAANPPEISDAQNNRKCCRE